MPESREPFVSLPWRVLVAVLAGWGVVLCSVIVLKDVIGPPSHGEFSRCLAEAGIYLPFLISFASVRPLRELLGALAPVRKAGLLLVLAGSLLTQLLGSSQVTFPFVAWTMFPTMATPSAVPVYEYELVSRDQSRRAVPLTHALGALNATRAKELIARLLRAVEVAPVERRARAEQDLQAGVRLLANAWRSSTGINDVQSIDVYVRNHVVQPQPWAIDLQRRKVASVSLAPEAP